MVASVPHGTALAGVIDGGTEVGPRVGLDKESRDRERPWGNQWD